MNETAAHQKKNDYAFEHYRAKQNRKFESLKEVAPGAVASTESFLDKIAARVNYNGRLKKV